MKPLVDFDVLLYELGFSSEKTEVIDGNKVVVPASWDFCQNLVDKRVELINEEVGATEAPLLFMTNTRRLNKQSNKIRELRNEPKKEFVDNFRYEVAKEKEYKGNRASTKPFHFYNIASYAIANYDVHINEDGLEADDAMCIKQYSSVKQGVYDTVICSRDKDVRMCPGLHYSWECGKQAALGPIMVDELGFLERRPDKKIWGVGSKFFYYQLLVGDSTDNIGGIHRRGPKFAFNLLKDATALREAYELVAEVYVKTWGDLWKKKLKEQAQLLWMIREVDESGKRVDWKPPSRHVPEGLPC